MSDAPKSRSSVHEHSSRPNDRRFSSNVGFGSVGGIEVLHLPAISSGDGDTSFLAEIEFAFLDACGVTSNE